MSNQQTSQHHFDDGNKTVAGEAYGWWEPVALRGTNSSRWPCWNHFLCADSTKTMHVLVCTVQNCIWVSLIFFEVLSCDCAQTASTHPLGIIIQKDLVGIWSPTVVACWDLQGSNGASKNSSPTWKSSAKYFLPDRRPRPSNPTHCSRDVVTWGSCKFHNNSSKVIRSKMTDSSRLSKRWNHSYCPLYRCWHLHVVELSPENALSAEQILQENKCRLWKSGTKKKNGIRTYTGRPPSYKLGL